MLLDFTLGPLSAKILKKNLAEPFASDRVDGRSLRDLGKRRRSDREITAENRAKVRVRSGEFEAVKKSKKGFDSQRNQDKVVANLTKGLSGRVKEIIRLLRFFIP
jgi:hypothetical protein